MLLFYLMLKYAYSYKMCSVLALGLRAPCHSSHLHPATSSHIFLNSRKMKFLPVILSLLYVCRGTGSPLYPREVISAQSVAAVAAAAAATAVPCGLVATSNSLACDSTLFPIHGSCNITLRRQLERGLDETVQLARYAKRHLLLHGYESPFVGKYFGNSSTANAIGWYDRVVSANKTGMLFRCDDPDRNCATQEGEYNEPTLNK